MTYEFARGLVNFLASEVVQPFAGEIINCVCSDVGDVLSVAVEYFSFHQITSSLADLHESCETPAVPWGEGMENANRNGAAGWFIVTWATSL